MKTAAIIAEYNPFHKGHQYHIEETRKKTGTDHILVVMSGDFVQRGAPSLVNKYFRTRMALAGGADVVIELPSLYGLSSAEYFAQGAVSLLNQLGAVDILSFGSEAGTLSPLMELAQKMLSPLKDCDAVIKRKLQEGCSYPAARMAAFPDTDKDLLSLPNNILGTEYCKALLASQSAIRPFTLKRTDTGYHQTSLKDPREYAAASAIRDALFKSPETVIDYVPSYTWNLLKDCLKSSSLLQENDFSLMLHYRLLLQRSEGFSSFLDCSPELSHRISRNIPLYTNFSEFCSLLKSRDLTYTRISRVLMHILLDMKTPEFYLPAITERKLFTPYARLLGFRQSASPLLSRIKKQGAIPLISKPSDASPLLGEEALALFKQDIFCSSVYEAAASAKSRSPLAVNELKQSPVIFP